MKKSKLRELLKEGAVSQDEFDEMMKTASDDPETADNIPANGGGAENAGETIETAVARATEKLASENSRLKGQLDKIKKEKLTGDEAKALELEEKDRQIQEREAALQEKENREYALKAIKTAGLDDGSGLALELVDFMLVGGAEAMDGRVKTFSDLFHRMVKAHIDQTFRENGRTVQTETGGGSGGANPYSRDGWNFTAQNGLELTNPQEARRLRELAGIHI